MPLKHCTNTTFDFVLAALCYFYPLFTSQQPFFRHWLALILRAEWTKLHQSWETHAAIIDALQVLDVLQTAAIWNDGDKGYTGHKPRSVKFFKLA